MEKIIISPALQQANSKSHKWILICMIPLFIIMISLYAFQLWTNNEGFLNLQNFLNGLMIGLLSVFLFIIISNKGVPKIEIEDGLIKAYLPNDVGLSAQKFELSTNDIEEVLFKLNLIQLKTKTGQIHEIQLSRFGYSDVQKLKAYFEEIDNSKPE